MVMCLLTLLTITHRRLWRSTAVPLKFHQDTITVPSLQPMTMPKPTSYLQVEHGNIKLPSRPKLILFYTTLWGGIPWSGFESSDKFNNWGGTQCEVRNCILTYDKNLADKADVLVFHGFGADMVPQEQLRSLSAHRHATQVWIYFVHEPPHTVHPRPVMANGFFNWTMNYRRDADITTIYNWEWGTWQAIPTNEPRQRIRDYSQGKDRLAYAIIGHCGLFREMYIKKLQEYIPIDVYGGCSTRYHAEAKICPRNSENCTQIKKRYKFFLAFENSFCKDYISEKFYETILDGNVVPVGLGGADYKSLAIRKSYINALDFDTVEDLANHLKMLDKNNTAYNEHQKWRESYKLGKPKAWSCEICRMANEKKLLRKSYSDLGTWYGEKGCGIHLDRLKSIFEKSAIRGPYKDQYYEM